MDKTILSDGSLRLETNENNFIYLENYIYINEKICGLNEYYYYLRTYDREPYVTVCFAYDNEHTYRGISICSREDFPIKIVGRYYAKLEMLKAYKRRRTADEINREESVNMMISTFFNCEDKSLFFDDFIYFFRYRSEIDPHLSTYESKLKGLRDGKK